MVADRAWKPRGFLLGKCPRCWSCWALEWMRQKLGPPRIAGAGMPGARGREACHWHPGEGTLQQCDCAVPQQKCPAQSHSGLATRRVGTSEVHSCLRLWRPCEALSQGRNIVLARITSLRMKRNLPSVKSSNHPTADAALIPAMTKCTVGGPISQADRGAKKELADLTSNCPLLSSPSPAFHAPSSKIRGLKSAR